MRLALGLATIGIGLGLIAVLGSLSQPSDAGDVAAVERAFEPVSTAAPDVGTSEPAAASSTEPSPLWAANRSSLLSNVDQTNRPMPVDLHIDAIGVDAPIGPYGVDERGRMDVPDNITEVGWYEYGPSPGESGSSVLAAHVDMAGPGRGVFYDLHRLEPGDLISIGYSDGTLGDFEVLARSMYLKSELPLDSIFSRQGPAVLTLVTCGGGFSRSAGSYDSNVVVYAAPLSAPNPGYLSPYPG